MIVCAWHNALERVAYKYTSVKFGSHNPCSRAVFTGREHGPCSRVSKNVTREHGPCSRAVNTAREHGSKKDARVQGPCSRPVNTAREHGLCEPSISRSNSVRSPTDKAEQ